MDDIDLKDLTIAGVSGNMSDKEKLELVYDALKDWRAGKLPAGSAMIAIDAFFNPVPISEEDIEAARKLIAEHPEWEK
jgi:hypothetical protein